MDILVLNKEKYSIQSEKDKQTLYYPDDREWSNPKTRAMSIEDTGNGYMIIDHSLEAKTYLDYSQFQLLQILMERLKGKPEYDMYSKVPK